jgi:hypothetical protein
MLQNKTLRIIITVVTLLVIAGFWFMIYINKSDLNLSFPTLFIYIIGSVFALGIGFWLITRVSDDLVIKLGNSAKGCIYCPDDNELATDERDWDPGGNT